MIQANELRLGNWVNIPECGINAKVDIIGENKFCINVDDVDLDRGTTDFHLTSANPILLTPEIVLTCGFTQNKSHKNIYHKGKWRIWLRQKWNYFFKSGERFDRPIESLHQLQNLYFALTGQELIYKQKLV